MPRPENPQEPAKKSPNSEPQPLPELTHLQFLVLDIMRRHDEGISANELREALATAGQEHQGPKFYQLMRRLVEARVAESWPQAFDVAGSSVERTYYRVTKTGQTAWRITVEFYRTRIQFQRVMDPS